MSWVMPPVRALPETAQAGRTDAAWSGSRGWVDDFGRLVAVVTPATGLESREYDANDRLVRRRLSDGSTWQWQRDALGRIVGHSVRRAGGPQQHTWLSYEGVRLVRIEHPNEQEQLAYDGLGRLSQRTLIRPAGSLHATESYEYDEADRLSAWYLPEGGSLHYEWGIGSQLKAVRHRDGQAQSVLGHTVANWLSEHLGVGQRTIVEPLPASGRSTAEDGATLRTVMAGQAANPGAWELPELLRSEQGYRWGNGVELRWHLGEQGQLAGMRYVGTQTPVPWHEQLVAWLPSAQAAEHGASPKALIELGYQYDPWGRMSERQQDGIRTGYAYDGQGRLLASQTLPVASSAAATTDAGQAQVEYYAYDRQGQMLASLTGGQATDWRDLHTQRDASGLPQRIEAHGVQRQLSYSADRRLIEVRQGGQLLASYSHYTHGQRIGKTLADGRST